MTERTANWLKKGRHLPRFLRDFHDQKDVFKSIDRRWGREEGHYAVNWMAAQCYVIDRFLKFMALHGYTLQRTRADVGTWDLTQTLNEDQDALGEELRRTMENRRAERAAATLIES